LKAQAVHENKSERLSVGERPSKKGRDYKWTKMARLILLPRANEMREEGEEEFAKRSVTLKWVHFSRDQPQCRSWLAKDWKIEAGLEELSKRRESFGYPIKRMREPVYQRGGFVKKASRQRITKSCKRKSVWEGRNTNQRMGNESLVEAGAGNGGQGTKGDGWGAVPQEKAS